MNLPPPFDLVAWVELHAPKAEENDQQAPATNGHQNGSPPWKATARNGRMTPLERCIAYLLSPGFPQSIEGQHGHSALYRAACEAWDSFGLTREECLAAVAEYNRQKASPPESDQQVAHKVDQAIKNHPSPSRKRLNADRPGYQGQGGSGKPSANGDGHKVEPWPPGTRVKATDRDNFGEVVSDEGGDKVQVYFKSPGGHEATVSLPRAGLVRIDNSKGNGKADDLDYSTLTDEELGLFSGVDVKVSAVRWAWEHRLAFGSAAMIAAEGGTGKTLVALYVATQITQGGPWADGAGNAPLGTVIILSAEDKAEDTLKPRLIALGADMARIKFLKARVTIKREGREPEVHPVSFQDLGYWQEVMRRVPDCRMLLVDPLPAYLGRGVNDHRNNEVRAVLEPFIQTIIEPRDCVLLCISHLNKSVDSGTPAHRIIGSVAYSNLPRNVHVAFKDPESEGRRIFGQVKCNNAPDDLPSLAFRVEKKTFEMDGLSIETAIPVFEAELVRVSVQQAMTGNGKPGPKPEKTGAFAEWLFDRLEGRPQPEPLGDIAAAAGEAGWIGKKKEDGKWSNFTALYRAKEHVAKLPVPRSGHVIDETEVSSPAIIVGSRKMAPPGRPRKYWSLTRLGAGEPENRVPF
jgi:putative DNA primase/helicase